MRYIDISFKNLFGSVPRGGLFIYLRVSVSAGLIRPAYVSSVSISFFLSSRHPPFRSFCFPFVSVGSAKVGIFFKLPNKIIFIFSFVLKVNHYHSSLANNPYSQSFIFSLFLPKRDAKVIIFSIPAKLILK